MTRSDQAGSDAAMRLPLWQRFFRDDPYTGFDADLFPDDCTGWNSEHPVFRALIAALRPPLIVEVGTWKGASAIHMAQTARDLGVQTAVLCIDTWLGTVESYLWRDTVPALYDDLRLRHGWPQLYYQFLANVCRRGLQTVIVPLAQASAGGLHMVKELGLRPDLIYIDASHQYDEVKLDLLRASAALAEDGVMFGDDYVSWPGVTQAVEEFCRERDLALFGAPGKWVAARAETLLARRVQAADGTIGGLSRQPL